MRKQTKVLAAAALFTLGASFSAFAAKKGTWVLEDEGWMCLDKDGEPYEGEWCLSGGKEFYVGDDGIMVTSDWVEHNNKYYYVSSEGLKTVNDWRFVTPYEEEDEDEEWFYFNAKGERVNSAKKVINGETYYFDEFGYMLTGWVNENDNVEVDSTNYDDTVVPYLVYCDEESGARINKGWINVYAADIDEDNYDDEDMSWYYLGSKGKVTTGKKSNINGETYLFNKEGQMQTGWVAYDTVAKEYKEIGTEADRLLGTGLDNYTYGNVYFCGDSDDGHVKKNKWIKEWRNTQYDEQDADDTQKWFWIDTYGNVFIPDAASVSNATAYDFKDGKLVTDAGYYDDFATKTIGKKTYAFNEIGEMVTGFVNVADDQIETAGMYYFGGSDDGSRKTGSLTIKDDCDDSYKFYFGTGAREESYYPKAVGVTGAKNGKLYIDGLLQTAVDAKYAEITIGDYSYLVNGSGVIQTSTTKEFDLGDREIKLDKVTFATKAEYTANPTLKGAYK